MDQLRYERVVHLRDRFERRCVLGYPGFKQLTKLNDL